MNGKRARNIRKLLNLKLPIAPDMRVMKEVEKYVYFEKPLTGENEMVKTKRVSIVNAAKYQYKQAKKKLRGMDVPDLRKQRANAPVVTPETTEEVIEEKSE